MKRQYQIDLLYPIAAVFAMIWIQQLLFQPNHIETIPYNEFQQLVDQGKVTDLVIGPDRITGAYKAPDVRSGAQDGQLQHFTVERVPQDLAEALASKGVTFSGAPGPGLLQNALSWIIPMLGFVLLWMFLAQRTAMGTGGGLMAIGKSKAKVYVENDTKVTFADVAGVDEAKDELEEIVAFLKDPHGYGRLGARMPKGVLLVGPPGTGKTLLARAVAGEAGVRFFSISGSEFVEMFVGVGAARVRDLFEQARKQAPSIIFIDELDALGRARGAMMPGGGHDEKEQTLNQLLTEMDGFDPSVGTVLLAATNRPEVLDPALLRAGRFDRQVLVDRPDKHGRIAILRVYLEKVKLAPDLPVENLAALTPGFTGAELANLVNEAALLATRRKAESIGFDDFTQAIERIVAGLEKKNRLLNPHERDVVAHHEMGHALVAMALPGVDPVQKVSIIPRGVAALGYTIQRPLEDRFLMDRKELMNRMAVLLGGRAAESIVYDEVSTGATDDLVKATEIARSMVTRFGMDPKLGQVAYEADAAPFLGGTGGASWQPRRYGEETASGIDAAVRELVEAAFQRAAFILATNRDLLGRAAKNLLNQETLLSEDLETIDRSVTRNAGDWTKTPSSVELDAATAARTDEPRGSGQRDQKEGGRGSSAVPL